MLEYSHEGNSPFSVQVSDELDSIRVSFGLNQPADQVSLKLEAYAVSRGMPMVSIMSASLPTYAFEFGNVFVAKAGSQSIMTIEPYQGNGLPAAAANAFVGIKMLNTCIRGFGYDLFALERFMAERAVCDMSKNEINPPKINSDRIAALCLNERKQIHYTTRTPAGSQSLYSILIAQKVLDKAGFGNTLPLRIVQSLNGEASLYNDRSGALEDRGEFEAAFQDLYRSSLIFDYILANFSVSDSELHDSFIAARDANVVNMARLRAALAIGKGDFARAKRSYERAKRFLEKEMACIESQTPHFLSEEAGYETDDQEIRRKQHLYKLVEVISIGMSNLEAERSQVKLFHPTEESPDELTLEEQIARCNGSEEFEESQEILSLIKKRNAEDPLMFSEKYPPFF